MKISIAALSLAFALTLTIAAIPAFAATPSLCANITASSAQIDLNSLTGLILQAGQHLNATTGFVLPAYDAQIIQARDTVSADASCFSISQQQAIFGYVVSAPPGSPLFYVVADGHGTPLFQTQDKALAFGTIQIMGGSVAESIGAWPGVTIR